MMPLHKNDSIGLLSRPQRAPERNEDSRNVEMGVCNAAFECFCECELFYNVMNTTVNRWHVQATILQDGDTLPA